MNAISKLSPSKVDEEDIHKLWREDLLFNLDQLFSYLHVLSEQYKAATKFYYDLNETFQTLFPVVKVCLKKYSCKSSSTDLELYPLLNITKYKLARLEELKEPEGTMTLVASETLLQTYQEETGAINKKVEKNKAGYTPPSRPLFNTLRKNTTTSCHSCKRKTQRKTSSKTSSKTIAKSRSRSSRSSSTFRGCC